MADGFKSGRLVSLDAFRGITIAGMILVNNPGDWGAIYSPFRHAEWNGLTPTDLIFPFFLFIVGVSIAIALGKRSESEQRSAVYRKIFRRTLVIFAFGLFLNAFPFFDLGSLRIPGVLQRIALCYMAASILFINLGWKPLSVLSAAILIAYWAVMSLASVPGCDIAFDPKACNPAAFVDRAILGTDHIWSLGKVYDPEGILSTIPAIVTTLSGVFAGGWLKSRRGKHEKCSVLLVSALLLLALGWAWSFWFPLNKSIWSSSYVVYTSGMALGFLAVCYWLIDIKGCKRWAYPAVVFGMNPLALYIGAETLSRLMDVIQVGSAGEPVSAKESVFGALFSPIAAPMTASLLYAFAFILLWYFLLWILYRRGIFIKI